MLLDDGSLKLKVTHKNADKEEVDGVFVEQVICSVIVGGILKPKKGINTPDIKVIFGSHFICIYSWTSQH